jgi:hypothetical protein
MKMWMVNPSKMCRQHLLGEHKELHMFVGALNKSKNLKGYYDKKLLNPHEIYSRHLELVSEMEKRGYNHQSPLPSLSNPITLPHIKINIEANEIELKKRCKSCFREEK